MSAHDLLAALPAELLGAAQQAAFGDGFGADDVGGDAGVDAEDDGDDDEEEEEEDDDVEDRDEEEVPFLKQRARSVCLMSSELWNIWGKRRVRQAVLLTLPSLMNMHSRTLRSCVLGCRVIISCAAGLHLAMR